MPPSALRNEQPNEIIRPALNSTYTLQAETDPGSAQEVRGQYGPQWMYFFHDHKLIYADARLHEAMTAARIACGDNLTITKTKNGNANVWRVENLGPTQGPQRALQQAAPPARPDAQTTAHLIVRQGGIPETTGVKPVLPISADRMLACYCEAVDVAIGAQAYAKQHDLLITPSFEDVRALAATLYINRVREEVSR